MAFIEYSLQAIRLFPSVLRTVLLSNRGHEGARGRGGDQDLGEWHLGVELHCVQHLHDAK